MSRSTVAENSEQNTGKKTAFCYKKYGDKLFNFFTL